MQPVKVGLEIGNKAPELELKDSKNVFIKLSSITNKFILIDFWASWCKSCRIENKNLIDIYNKFKGTTFKDCKGFEIYSISIDSNKKGWINGMNNDRYNWKYNVLDSAAWDKTGSFLYNITYIPQNFLIDSKGIIIAKNLRGSAVEETLIKLLKNK